MMQHWDMLMQGGGALRRGMPAAGKLSATAAATHVRVAGAVAPRDVVLGAVDCGKAESMKPGKELGCGEQGCTYQLTPHKVLKITTWKMKPTPRVWRAWEEEGLIGRELGALGIAPRVYDAFKCKNTGYIVMDMLTPLTKELPGVKGKDLLGTVVDIKRFPVEDQNGFAQVLSTMAANGFVHMDNHLGNLGFFAGTRKPLVFDFGFTQRRRELSHHKSDQLWALALSLFIMLEHVADVAALEQSALCQHALTALASASLPPPVPRTLRLKTMCKLLFPAAAGEDVAKAAARNLSSSNTDIYVACLAYLVVLQLPREERYNHALYGTLHLVRKAEFKI